MGNHPGHDERDPAGDGRALRALRELIRGFNVTTKKLERGLGLSGAQLEALEILRDNPGLSPSDLACRSATDQSTASVVVKRLADAGFVDRRKEDGDRRRTRLTLTPEGEAVLDKAPPSLPSRLRSALMRMAHDDRVALTTLLERWLALAGLRRAA
jgi:DNA-binding MarR family transcriptional regulator